MKAIAAKPGLAASAASPSDRFYDAITDEFPELRDHARLGLKLVQSKVPRTADSGSFAPVSWERTGDPDLLLLDPRPTRCR